MNARCVTEAIVHHLKILPEYFTEVSSGLKTAEIRRHDRDFMIGDVLMLNEWDGQQFTGRYVVREITHIVHGGRFGIEQGFCLLSMSGN